MKNLLLILVLSLNFYSMEAQKKSQSTTTTFSETDTFTTAIENNEETTEKSNAIIAKFESNITSNDTFKQVFSIIEKKLGKPLKTTKKVIKWKNDANENDYYTIFLKENSILIDYSGTREKSVNRKNISQLIEEIEKVTKLN